VLSMAERRRDDDDRNVSDQIVGAYEVRQFIGGEGALQGLFQIHRVGSDSCCKLWQEREALVVSVGKM
jgi:hypothetical protein